MDYIIGLDLGQVSDPTALCVLRRSMLLTDEGLPSRDHRRRPRYKFDGVHLERYTLGTSYPAVVDKVRAVAEGAKLRPRPLLAIDATGVGRAVVDMFIDAKIRAEIVPITLTAGEKVRRERWNKSACIGYWVPKNEVVGTTQALLQSGRLKVAKGLPLADDLKRELLGFRMKITAHANETFNAREGEHDDILLAVACAAWLGEEPPPGGGGPSMVVGRRPEPPRLY